MRLDHLGQAARAVLAAAGAISPFLGYQPGFASSPYPGVVCLAVNMSCCTASPPPTGCETATCSASTAGAPRRWPMTSPVAGPTVRDLMQESLDSVPVSSFSITAPVDPGPPGDAVDGVIVNSYDAVAAAAAALDRRSSHATDVLGTASTVGTPVQLPTFDHSQPAATRY